VLSKVGRLVRKLQRLRLVDAQFAEVKAQALCLQADVAALARGFRGDRDQAHSLQEQAHSLQEQVQSLRAELHREREQGDLDRAQVRSVQAVIDGLVEECRSLREGLGGLREEVYQLRHRCDLARSMSEIPRSLFDEFERWKACQPPVSEPLISVCVATYDRARLLTERCIPSVLGQTYSRLELIVVGDGCTDETEALVARIRDDRLAFTNLPARGDCPKDRMRRWMVAGTQAANAALSSARGDFITYLDDDDEYFPDRLEKLVDFAIAHSSDFVWHPFWYEIEPGRWALHEASDLELGQVTTSSVFYRGWFKRIAWDVDAHLLGEPGDWNLFRRIKFLGPTCNRYPAPLLRHYQERNRPEE
jgi:hypothetical protein